MQFWLEYIGYWSQTRVDRLYIAKTTAKVNNKHLSQYQYFKFNYLCVLQKGELIEDPKGLHMETVQASES
jgi:hypothetical protein